MEMDSAPLVAKLRRDCEDANARLRESKHDPRVLDTLVHEYRLIAEMAIMEAERLQQTIYEHYTRSHKK